MTRLLLLRITHIPRKGFPLFNPFSKIRAKYYSFALRNRNYNYSQSILLRSFLLMFIKIMTNPLKYTQLLFNKIQRKHAIL